MGEPCGRPALRVNWWEVVDPNLMCLCMLSSADLITAHISGWIPRSFSICSSFECSTVSYAFLRSRKAIKVGSPREIRDETSSVSRKTASEQLRSERNPY